MKHKLQVMEIDQSIVDAFGHRQIIEPGMQVIVFENTEFHKEPRAILHHDVYALKDVLAGRGAVIGTGVVVEAYYDEEDHATDKHIVGWADWRWRYDEVNKK